MSEQPYKWMKTNEASINIAIKVIPNSSKNSITVEEDYVKIKLTAPPVDNKANTAIIEFLAKRFKVPKTSVSIISGHTSKNKIISLPLNTSESIKSLINSD